MEGGTVATSCLTTDRRTVGPEATKVLDNQPKVKDKTNKCSETVLYESRKFITILCDEGRQLDTKKMLGIRPCSNYED